MIGTRRSDHVGILSFPSSVAWPEDAGALAIALRIVLETDGLHFTSITMTVTTQG